MKKSLLVLVLVLMASPGWARQAPQVTLDFPELAKRASEVVKVDLPKGLLSLAASFLSSKDDPDVAKIKKLLSGLQGIYVRSYEFEKDSDFSVRDLDPLRKMITGSGWNCLVSVHSKKSNEDTDVCLRQDGDKILGLAIVSTEPRKLTLVNILGSIAPEDLTLLREFGVPEMNFGGKSKSTAKDQDKEPKSKSKAPKDKEKDNEDEN